MAQFVVRNLEDEVKERLQRRAKKHGRSMEAEVRDILRNAVAGGNNPAGALGTRLASRFAQIGLERPIEELRGHPATPAGLDE